MTLARGEWAAELALERGHECGVADGPAGEGASLQGSNCQQIFRLGEQVTPVLDSAGGFVEFAVEEIRRLGEATVGRRARPFVLVGLLNQACPDWVVLDISERGP